RAQALGYPVTIEDKTADLACAIFFSFYVMRDRSSFDMTYRTTLLLSLTLQACCSIKLPVSYRRSSTRSYFRTENAVNGEKVHPIVDTGSVSFYVVGENYFEDWCRRYPPNCYNLPLSELIDQTLQRVTGKRSVTRSYTKLTGSMCSLKKQVELGAPESFKIKMQFYVVVDYVVGARWTAWERTPDLKRSSAW
ncbi:hypothetical protein FOZ62_011038, partial [Perkinsus olseni]